MAEETETRRERFERLFPPRVDKVLKSLDVLGNCASRATYEYTEDDVDEMVLAILNGIDECKRKFMHQRSQRHSFALGASRGVDEF